GRVHFGSARQMAVQPFVVALSRSTASARLREVFAAHGSVESARVVTDRDTGRPRGSGFVEMTSEQDAQQAVSRLNGQDVDGRQIKVEVAKPSERGGGDRGGPRGGGGRGGRW